MAQIENLCYKVTGQQIIDLALECRFEQKLRHTPLWLLILANDIHNANVKDAIARVANRPDMTMDLLQMLKARNGSYKMSKSVKGVSQKLLTSTTNTRLPNTEKQYGSIFDRCGEPCTSKPTPENEKALKALVEDTLKPANIWK